MALAVICGGDSLLQLDLETRKFAAPIHIHGEVIDQFAATADGKQVALGVSDQILLFDSAGHELDWGRGVVEVPHAKVSRVAISPDGSRLLTLSDEAIAWDATTFKPLSRFPVSWVGAVALAPDGGQLLAGGQEGLTLVDASTGAPLRTFPREKTAGPEALAWSPDGKFFASRHGKSTQVWELETGRVRWEVEAELTANLVYSPDGRFLLGGDAAGGAQVFDGATGKELRRLMAGKDTLVTDLAIAPNGKRVYAAIPGGLAVWELATGRLLKKATRNDSEGTVGVLVVSPDGKTILVGAGSVVHGFDAGSLKRLRRFEGHQGAATALAVSADGKTLLSGSEDLTALVWRLTPK